MYGMVFEAVGIRILAHGTKTFDLELFEATKNGKLLYNVCEVR